MTRLFLPVLLFFTARVCVANEQATEPIEKPWSVDSSVAYYSDYMWRGLNLYDGASIQPAILATYDTGYGELSAELWFHISAEGEQQSENFFEIDNSLKYNYATEVRNLSVNFTVGHVWYSFPDAVDEIQDSADLFGSVAIDDSAVNPWFSLNPELRVFYEYRVTDSQYYEVGLSHEFAPEIWQGVFGFTPYVNFGFASNAEQVFRDSGGLMQVTSGVRGSLTLGNWELVPELNFSGKVDDATSNKLWYGLTVFFSI